MLFVIAALLALILAVLAYFVFESRLKTPNLTKKTVSVNTKDGQTVRGVLIASHADRLTLDEAFYVTNQGETKLDGLAHVPTANVSFIQELEPKVGV